MRGGREEEREEEREGREGGEREGRKRGKEGGRKRGKGERGERKRGRDIYLSYVAVNSVCILISSSSSDFILLSQSISICFI